MSFQSFFIKIKNKSRQTLSQFHHQCLYHYLKHLPPSSYRRFLTHSYQKHTGKKINWDNPQTFNEKIQILKLNQNWCQQVSPMADKLKVRDYVKSKIGDKYLTQIFGVWSNPENIVWQSLPSQFVIKANHGCEMNLIVKDKAQLNISVAKKTMKCWLHTNFAFCNNLELQYQPIKPLLLAEQYLENHNGDLYDYKVWCFNGQPHYIMFLRNRHRGLLMSFYDLKWRKQNFCYNYPQDKKTIPRPDNLSELITISKKLAYQIPFVRLDFYRLNNGAWKFGEMTFTPASGMCLWQEEKWNLKLGKLLICPPFLPHHH
jgi:hypothetical protein